MLFRGTSFAVAGLPVTSMMKLGNSIDLLYTVPTYPSPFLLLLSLLCVLKDKSHQQRVCCLSLLCISSCAALPLPAGPIEFAALARLSLSFLP